MINRRILPSVLLALALASLSRGQVSDLRCEFSVDPLGIDTAQPRLSWRIAGAEPGKIQTAYELIAGTSPAALGQGRGDLWESGRIPSARTLLVPYAGVPLRSAETVYWKVRSWDQSGTPSAWSAPARWTMGLLAPSDWKAQWLAAPGATESLLLRGEFNVRPGLIRALAFTCGLGQYEYYLNGAKVGQDLLAPGWTNYDTTALYATRDVTALLRPGANAAGMLLGNGMYDVVRRDRFVKFTAFAGPLRAIALLRLEYADGSVDWAGSGGSWRCHPGPITTGNIYSGEDYDARLEPPRWSQAGFDASQWEQPVVSRTNPVLHGHEADSEPIRAIESETAVAVQRFPDGTAVYDFGQNASHLPRLTVSGPAGSVIRLTPSEVVNPDGTINRNTMDGKNRGNAWWQYIKATDQPETWLPKFYYVGCRYLKVQGFASTAALPFQVPAEDSTQRSQIGPPLPPDERASLPHVLSLEAVVVHAAATPIGQFETSNDRLNRIRDLVRWSQRSNLVSVLTDCPHREKLGWLEQYHLNGPALRYEFAVERIFTKGMHDMADAQTAAGLIPNIAPEFVKFEGTFRAAAEWGAAFILVPWQQYEFSGDEGLCRTYYPRMKRYVAYLRTRAVDDTISDGLGDWFDLGPNPPGVSQNTPPPITASAFYYADVQTLAQIAGLLGQTADAAQFASEAARIRASYNRHFYHAETGSYATGSQCANALPLVLGIVEPANRSRVLAALVTDLEKRDYAMTTGDIGFRSLLQALAEGGRSDVIYRMINQDAHPGYGYQLKRGATSLTEAWDANLNTSHNHFMLGQITEWFYRDLAGIAGDPAGPGFARILLRPNPVGDLGRVAATYDSVRGPIAVRWERSGGHFRYEVTIPANTHATLYLPSRGAAPPEPAPAGARFLRQESDRAVYSLASGHYAFAADW